MQESYAVPTDTSAGKTFTLPLSAFNASLSEASEAFFAALSDVDAVVDETSTWPANPKTYTVEDFLTTYGLETNSTLKFTQDKMVFRVDGTLSVNGDYWYESRVAHWRQEGIRKQDAFTVYRYARLFAGTGIGAKHHRFGQVRAWDPGDNETTAAHREEARADYDRTLKQLRRAPARRSCPPWFIPGRLWLLLMWQTLVRRGKMRYKPLSRLELTETKSEDVIQPRLRDIDKFFFVTRGRRLFTEVLAPDGIASGLAQVGLFMGDKNAPDEFGVVFQGVIDTWQATVTKKRWYLRAQPLRGCGALLRGHALFADDVLEQSLMARAFGRPTGTVGSSVSFTPGQLLTSLEIEEVRGLSCGALNLEFDAEKEVAHELHSQRDL